MKRLSQRIFAHTPSITAGLVLLAVALTALLAFRAFEASRAQQQLTQQTLREYAGFAVFQLKNATTARITGQPRGAFEHVLRTINRQGPTPPMGAERAAALIRPKGAECRCLEGVSFYYQVNFADSSIEATASKFATTSQLHSLFWQGERSAAETQGGLGIGLSLVRTLVEMHHGTVTVSSEGAGTGSEFVVTLPLATSGMPVDVAAEPVQEQRIVRKVLVVDDSRDAGESLAALLRLDGHDVQVAFDGEQALELALQMRPDVILLDIGLPGLDGYGVCRRIRASGLGDAEIIAMTGYGQDRDRQLSHEAGFDRHLVKPVNIPELLSGLRSFRA